MIPRAWSLFGVVTLLACSSDGGPGAGGATQDAATSPDAAEQCAVPEGPYGMAVGSNFPRAALTDCTTEEPYVLYDKAEFCGPRVTFMSLAAGWCGTCQAEANRLEREVNQRYAGRGVRVLQVIVQNPNTMPGTPDFCRMWQERYHLTNRMLVDPSGTVRRFASGNLPGSVIFDHTGRIRYVGHAASLNAIRYQIDSILDGVAEP